VLVAEEPAEGLVQVNMFQEKIHLLLTDVIMNSELSKLSPQRMTETSNFTHT